MTGWGMAGWLFAVAISVAAQGPSDWSDRYEAAIRAKEAGETGRAEAILAEAVREAEAAGKDDPRVAEPLMRTGLLLMDKALGRPAEAEPHLRRALAIREKALKPDDPATAEIRLNLALCLTLSKPDKGGAEAGGLLEKAVAVFASEAHRDDRKAALALQTLAVWHAGHASGAPAEAAMVRALAHAEKAYGAESEKFANALDNLGEIHTMLAFTLNLFSAETPPTPANVLKATTNSGRNLREAEAAYKRALAIREKALGPDHPDTAKSLHRVARTALAREQADEAEPYLERWLAIDARAADDARADPETTFEVLWMLAEASTARKDWDEADRRLARAQAFAEQNPGADGVDAAGVVQSRADVALRAGRFDAAETFLKAALDRQAARLGGDAPEVVEARALTADGYKSHVDDRDAPRRWNRLRALAANPHQFDDFGHAVKGFAALHRRTNRVVPPPDADDLAYLKRAELVIDSTTLDDLPDQAMLLGLALGDEALPHVARLYGLERLQLDQSATDAGLVHLKNLTNLKALALIGARVTDDGLAPLAALTDLEDLDLSFSGLGDGALTHLSHLPRLKKLGLRHTKVTDAGLDRLAALKPLRDLDLTETKVTPEGLDRLKSARPDLTVKYRPRTAGTLDAVDEPVKPPVPPGAAEAPDLLRGFLRALKLVTPFPAFPY